MDNLTDSWRNHTRCKELYAAPGTEHFANVISLVLMMMLIIILLCSQLWVRRVGSLGCRCLVLVLVSLTSFRACPSGVCRSQFLLITPLPSSPCLILHLRLQWISQGWSVAQTLCNLIFSYKCFLSFHFHLVSLITVQLP